jgi:hypothetical protein
VVNNQAYSASVNDAAMDQVTRRVLIHYDPRNPVDHQLGTLTSPWIILAFTFSTGAFLLFVGYQFR